MTTQIIQSLVNKDGKRVEMPAWFSGEPDNSWGNLAHPDPFVLTTVPQYPIGTKFVDGDRTWFYSKFKGVVDSNFINLVDQDCGTHMFGKGLIAQGYSKDYGAGAVKALTASRTIVIGPTDTGTEAGTVAVDHYYSGGMIMTYDPTAGDNKFESYRIVESRYSATSIVVSGTTLATPTTLTVDHDTPVPVTASAIAVVSPNEWKHGVYAPNDADTVGTILGASCVGNITGAGYLWLQTYGRIGAGHWTAALPGSTVGEVDVIWHTDGAMDPKVTKPTYQKAGYVIPNSMSMDGSPTSESYCIVFLTMQR